MKKLKYYYNPKTLNYEKVEVKWSNKLWRFFGWFSTTVFFALILFSFFAVFFEPPQIIHYKRENTKLISEIKLMQQELEMINDVVADLQERDENIYRVIFEAEPISSNIREAGFGGRYMFERFEGYDNAEILKNLEGSLQRMKRKLYVQSKSYDEIAKLIKNKEGMLNAIPAIQPISNSDLTRLASGFGYRMHPILKTVRFHEGTDFAAPRGTEIYATGDGVVERAQFYRGHGNMVIIDHGYGYKTSYSHMHEILVKRGQSVKRGEIIGTVGSTGLSTAPHLHYEVIKNGVKVNPINFFFHDLTPEEYERLIVIANTANQSFD